MFLKEKRGNSSKGLYYTITALAALYLIAAVGTLVLVGSGALILSNEILLALIGPIATIILGLIAFVKNEE